MSLSKNKIKYIQSLKQKKYRNQHNTFVAEGSKLIFDLMPHLLCQLLIIDKEMETHASSHKAEEVIIATRDEIKKASHLATPPDAIAVFYQSHQNLSETDLNHQLTLVLDGVQDPGNLGTIIRIADWFGIENIVCSTNTVEIGRAHV